MKYKRPRMPQFILEDRLTPPTYQVELISSALHHNTVLCVSNDNGLDFVPIMLMKSISDRAADSQANKTMLYISPDGEKGKKSCKENTDRVRLHSAFKVTRLGGDDSCDVTSSLSCREVICLQGSQCLSMLAQGVLDFEWIRLIVFDECHAALEPNSSYANIVKLLKKSPYHQDVRIFGVTASIISGVLEEPKELGKKISELELALHSFVETTTDMSAMETPHVNRDEITEVYEPDDVTGSDDTGSDALQLTQTIRSVLQHAYHFLGDMIISQTDLVKSKEAQASKKMKSKSGDGLSLCDNITVSEPPLHSKDWYNMQAYKDVPRKVFQEVETALDDLGAWCAGCVALNVCSTLQKIIERTTEPFEKKLLQLAWTQLKYIHMLVQKASESFLDEQSLLQLSTPKVRKLISILKSFLPKVDFEITSAVSSYNRAAEASSDDLSDISDLSDGESHQDPESFTVARVKQEASHDNVVKVNQEETTLTGLVFVKRKHSAFALHKYIEELCIWDMDMYFIRSSYMIGSGESEDGKDDLVKSKKQDQRLLQFRQHKVNLLIGTRVLESNIDLPKCNLIAMFDPPQSYQSYIKSKARAKSFNAKYYTICSMEEKESLTRCLSNFNQIEEILQRKLHKPSYTSQPYTEKDLRLVPAFVEPKTGATVTIANAIGLLNRYCAKLPSDMCTRLIPTSHVTELPSGYQATISLPVNCRLKHSITGDVMPSHHLAVAAAALSTCEELYMEGELDTHLAPIGKEYLRSSKQDADWERERGSRHSKGVPGSSKAKRYYNKKIADQLSKPIAAEETCFLYSANLSLAIAMDQDKHNKGRDIFVTQEYPYTVGFLVKERLPSVAEFPVFTRSGQESVAITFCCECRLNQSEYSNVLDYHSFVFHNVLRIDKFPLKLNTSSSPFNILVVPVDSGQKVIAWEYMDTTMSKMAVWSNRPPLFSRKTKEFVFREEDFKDAVVMPSYRNQDQPEFFYVAAMRHDLSPKAPFPSPDLYSDFYSYYTSKYGLAITNTSQPLLDVDRTSGRLNLMTPRYMNQKGMPLPAASSHNRKNKKLTTRERQILIPELCDIHPCTASMWRKLVCVPSILYRLNSLLLSHQLACRINKGMNLACLSNHHVPSGDKLDLGIDFSLLQAPSASTQCSSNSNVDEAKPNTEQTNESAGGKVLDAEQPKEKGDQQKLEESGAQLISLTDLSDPDLADVDSENDISEVESEESEDEDEGIDSIPVDLELDREENTHGQGPSATMILHALTMSNASDFINLERLETVGDSFLKFAVTLYLFCTHPGLHEGRLSYGRGKQVSNFNLFLLGRKLGLAEYLLSEKFEPTENWLPPCYKADEDHKPMEEFRVESAAKEKGSESATNKSSPSTNTAGKNPLIPYNLRTQHSIPDKTIADCVESLIGCYLTSCGPYAARVFMAWLGINVLPSRKPEASVEKNASISELDYGFKLPQPPPGLIRSGTEAERQLTRLFSGLEEFEESIGYKFRDKAYLVQAFTHSSYIHNNVTDCYQRLEFLGDAVLDYVITRRLFEDKRKHSPGILTDLRSALVNNNVFAALAVKWNFHKHVKCLSTHMLTGIHKYVQHQKGRADKIQVDQYLRLSDDGENDEEEEVEIPKVLGDIFESVAGAIYIDSNMSLDTLWKVYFPLMRQQIVQFSRHIPKSPVRELLEREPETAKFQKPERTKDGRARVSVTIAGKDTWWGVGRSYRIAKSAAAKKALIALNAMES